MWLYIYSSVLDIPCTPARTLCHVFGVNAFTASKMTNNCCKKSHILLPAWHWLKWWWTLWSDKKLDLMSLKTIGPEVLRHVVPLFSSFWVFTFPPCCCHAIDLGSLLHTFGFFYLLVCFLFYDEWCIGVRQSGIVSASCSLCPVSPKILHPQMSALWASFGFIFHHVSLMKWNVTFFVAYKQQCCLSYWYNLFEMRIWE